MLLPDYLRKLFLGIVIASLLIATAACSRTDEIALSNLEKPPQGHTEQNADLAVALTKLQPFFKPMGKPARYDWLASNTEPGQTFAEYLESDPVKPTPERQRIYVIPIGPLTTKQRKVFKLVTGYLAVFYDLPVQQLPGRSIRPTTRNKRRDRFTGVTQIRTSYILNEILKPATPADAAAMIAITSFDLFPSGSMNFVFGQASLEDRVGVWSLHRLDDNTTDNGFVLRTLKIAAHETGHMFSMRHCTKYECLMSGTNHIGETDRRPLDACPECTAKICWLSDVSLADRYKRLITFCRNNGLQTHAKEFEAKLVAVEGL